MKTHRKISHLSLVCAVGLLGSTAQAQIVTGLDRFGLVPISEYREMSQGELEIMADFQKGRTSLANDRSHAFILENGINPILGRIIIFTENTDEEIAKFIDVIVQNLNFNSEQFDAAFYLGICLLDYGQFSRKYIDGQLDHLEFVLNNLSKNELKKRAKDSFLIAIAGAEARLFPPANHRRDFIWAYCGDRGTKSVRLEIYRAHVELASMGIERDGKFGFYDKPDIEACMKTIKSVLKRSHDNADAIWILAKAYAFDKNVSKATEYFRQYLSLNETRPWMRRLATAYIKNPKIPSIQVNAYKITG